MISKQYSGTGALKTDFTRTGKRTAIGAANDGVNSLVRYIKNNFCDGDRQDSLDLFLGKYHVDKDYSPFEDATDPSYFYLVPCMMLVVMAILFLNLLLSLHGKKIFTRGDFIIKQLITFICLVLLYSSVKFIKSHGTEFVNMPKLVPPFRNPNYKMK